MSNHSENRFEIHLESFLLGRGLSNEAEGHEQCEQGRFVHFVFEHRVRSMRT